MAQLRIRQFALIVSGALCAVLLAVFLVRYGTGRGESKKPSAGSSPASSSEATAEPAIAASPSAAIADPDRLIAVSFERAYVNPDRTSADGQSHKELLVVRESKLPGFSAKVDKVTRGKFKLVFFEGVPCIIPTGQSSHEIESSLDTQVSIHVDQATTWEAVKALAQAINSAPETPRVLKVDFCTFVYYGAEPAFRKDKCQTLHMENVPARDVLAGIIARSTTSFMYIYNNIVNRYTYPKPFLYSQVLLCSPNERGMYNLGDVYYREEQSEEDAHWWVQELKEVDRPFRDALGKFKNEASDQ